MELSCALREELISFFDDETLSQTNQKLQDPIVFHAMTCIRFSFLKKMVGMSERKLLKKLEENQKRKRRRCMCNSCTPRALGVNPQVGYECGRPRPFPSLFIALSLLLLVYYQKSYFHNNQQPSLFTNLNRCITSIIISNLLLPLLEVSLQIEQ